MGYRPLRASAPSNNDGLNQPLLQAQPPPMPNQPPPMPNPVHAPGRRNCISLCKSIRCPVRGPCRGWGRTTQKVRYSRTHCTDPSWTLLCDAKCFLTSPPSSPPPPPPPLHCKSELVYLVVISVVMFTRSCCRCHTWQCRLFWWSGQKVG